jgi:DUF4097 and DUF4098 domain-containing protein YvlB
MRRESFATPEPLRLDLRLQSGEIEVRAEATGETVVELEPLGGDDSTRAVEEARVELRDGVLVVDVPESRGFRLLSRGSGVRLTIACPSGSSVRSRSGSADVRASGLLASVDVETGSGDLEIDDVGGDASAKSGSGDVRVGRVGGELAVQTGSGDVTVDRLEGAGAVRSASGDVVVRDAVGSLSVQTASGDQRIEAVSAGEVTLRSASGDIHVGVRRGSSVWIDAASMSGETTSELEMDGAPPEEEPGGRHVELRAQAMSGDIHVARAAAASELEA